MRPAALRRHVAWYGHLLALTPPEHRHRHAGDQILLFGDLLHTGESAWRLWARAVPDLARVLLAHRAVVLAHTSRFALGALSAAPIGLAVVVGWISVDEYGDVPGFLPLVAVALLLQGVFTLLWLSGRLDRWKRVATDLFVAGEVMALALGSIAVAAALLAGGGEPEVSSALVGVVVATHALIGLVAVITTRPRPPGP